MRVAKWEPLKRRVWKAEPLPALPDDLRKSPEARERMRQARLAYFEAHPEARERMRQAQLGRKRGPYQKRKRESDAR